MEILAASFFTFLALLFSGQLLRLQFGTVAITAGDVGIVLLVIIWTILLIGRKISFPLNKPIYLIGVFLITCIISLLVNLSHLKQQEFFIAFLYIIRWGAYACLYPISMILAKRYRSKVFSMLVLLSCIVVSLGFLQYAFYPSLRNLYYLGWDEHLYRLFSVFLDPNFAAAAISLALFLFIYLFIQSTGRTKIFIAIGMLLSVIAIFLTYSRSGIIMALAGICTFAILYKKTKYLLIVFAIVAVVYLIESKSFYLENKNLFRTSSSVARIQTSQTALAIFQKNIPFGVGFDAYRYAQIRYGYRSAETQFVSHADAGTDNSFLFILATTGVIGFLVYIDLWKNLIQTCMVRKGKVLSDQSKLVIVTTIGIACNALFINSLFYPFIMAWMWILLGLTERTSL